MFLEMFTGKGTVPACAKVCPNRSLGAYQEEPLSLHRFYQEMGLSLIMPLLESASRHMKEVVGLTCRDV